MLAQCEVQVIDACLGGDGCCPAGCEGMDTDCDAGGGGGGGGTGGGTNDGSISGGCAVGAGGGGVPAFALLGGLAVILRRRPRR